ncbi:MAG TPA: glycosyltransferase [Candidatus Binatia bacterium]|nr:glycosyltransferase [Candidatus Binatia bacterium]
MSGRVEHEGAIEFSAVVSCYFEQRSVKEFHGRLRGALAGLGRSFEIVYVNDGSTDGTLDTLREIFSADSCVGVVIDLFKNSGSAAAVAAGCAAARGRHFVFIDSDLQLDPEELPRLVSEFDKGMDLVNGVRRERRDSWVRAGASRVVNAALRRISGASVLDLGCTFKVANGDLVRGLAPGPHRVLNPVHLAAGARDCANVPVTHHPRRYGSSGWSVAGLIALTIDTLLGLSHHPFQILSIVNLVVASAVVLRIAAGVFSSGAIFPPITNGLILNVVVLSLATMVAIVCLVGEYVLRMHRSIEGPPRYVIRSIWSRPVKAVVAGDQARAVSF